MWEQAQGKVGEVPHSFEAQVFVNTLLFIYLFILEPFPLLRCGISPKQVAVTM